MNKFHLPLLKLFASLVLLFGAFSSAKTQVNLSYSFPTNLSGWTGNGARTTVSPCSAGGSVRFNLYNTVPTMNFVSPYFDPQAQQVTITYSTKCLLFSNIALAANTGTVTTKLQWATSTLGPWTDLVNSTYPNVNSVSCVQNSASFTPGFGNVYVRFNTILNNSNSDVYFYLDDITISSPAPVQCSNLPSTSTISSSTTNICAGSSATINCGDFGLSIDGMSPTWYMSQNQNGPFTLVENQTYQPYYYTSTDLAPGIYYFYLNTYCSNTNQNSVSNQISIEVTGATVNSSPAQFCVSGGSGSINLTLSSPASNISWSTTTSSASVNGQGTSANFIVSETSEFRASIDFANGLSCVKNSSIGVYPITIPNLTASKNSVCPGDNVNINAGLSTTNYEVDCINYLPYVAPNNVIYLANNGIETISLASGTLDNGGWGTIQTVFPFSFFGSNYDVLNIGTNGIIRFGGHNITQMADNNFASIPNSTDPNCSIYAAANDLHCGTPSSTSPTYVRYWIQGYAPDRKFIVEYNVFQKGSTVLRSNIQIVLCETTNFIEIYAKELTSSNQKTIGLNNYNGTIGITAPQCTSNTLIPQFWQLQQSTIPLGFGKAWRFVPPANYTTSWTATNSNGTNALTSGNNVLSQSIYPLSTTTYSFSYLNQTTGCQSPPNSSQITINVLNDIAPTNVNAFYTPNNLCTGTFFNLYTDFSGSSESLTLQWQVSTNNGLSFNDIPNGTTMSFYTSQTQTSIYRLKIISCGGIPSYSSTVSVPMSSNTNCYCVPTLTNGCGTGDVIARVVLNTLDNLSGTGCPIGTGFADYTTSSSLTTTLQPLTSYQCFVYAGKYNRSFAAWIDYNNDGVFDNTTERIGYTTNIIIGSYTPNVLGSCAIFNFTTGCPSLAGQHRLRIRTVDEILGVNISPCSNNEYGEIEDYMITIAPGPSCPAPGLTTIGAVSSNSASLNWDLGCSISTSFDIEFGPQGFTSGSGTLLSNVSPTIIGNTATYTISDLIPNSNYNVLIRANCGNNDFSSWSQSINFSTPCAPISLNNPGDQIACNSYALQPIIETVASNNANLQINYYSQANGLGTQLSGSLTNSQTIYIYAQAGICSADSSFELTVNESTYSTLTDTACSSYFWNNQTYFSSGTYTYQTLNAIGCDSIATLILIINQPTNSTHTHTECISYAWNNQTYTNSGIYNYVTVNSLGCDSTATLNLTITQPTSSTLNILACQTYTFNSESYSNSGTYTQIIQNESGCDSIITLNLTLGTPDSVSITQIVCDSFNWDNTYYSNSGQFTNVYQNIFGCDSTVILDLTVNNSSVTMDSVFTCDSYFWNEQTYTNSGIFTYSTTNMFGCDSTATLKLKIGKSDSLINIVSCDSYNLNGQNFTQTGVYTQVLTNIVGCDSTIFLNLTINQTPSASVTDNGNGILIASSGVSYQWIECSENNPIQGETTQTFNVTENGSYAVIVSNENTCYDTSSCFVIDYIGLFENTFNFKLFPNPTKDNVTLIISGIITNFEVKIEDLNGRIFEDYGQLISGKGLYNIKLNKILPGVYFITLSNGINQFKEKIIVY